MPKRFRNWGRKYDFLDRIYGVDSWSRERHLVRGVVNQKGEQLTKKTMKPYDLAREFRVLTLRETAVASNATTCDTPDKAAEYWRQVIATQPHFASEQEQLYVLCLNTRRRVTGHVLIALGTLDTITVHPREVFRAAIVAAASGILLMHNHPSGDPTPSDADIRGTRELINAGRILKIDVVDHVIIGERTESTRGFTSLRELGHFYT